MPRVDAARRGQREASLLLIRYVDEREWEVLLVRRERLRRGRTDLLPRQHLRRLRGKLTEGCQLPLADAALRVVRVDADDPFRGAVLARDRAVGERVVGLLAVSVALHDQKLRLHVGALR